MFSLVWIRPMFEQEAPKWPWELFNDADSNTIHVGSQRGLSHDSNMIKKLPSELGNMPIKWVSTAMFSLVWIRPMFEQETPKWPLWYWICTAGLHDLCSKGDNPIFRNQDFQMFMIVIWWRLIIQSQAGLIETTYMLQLWSKRLQAKTKKLFAKRDFKNFEASDSNTIRKPFQRG